jgi:hypothetical protein
MQKIMNLQVTFTNLNLNNVTYNINYVQIFTIIIICLVDSLQMILNLQETCIHLVLTVLYVNSHTQLLEQQHRCRWVQVFIRVISLANNLELWVQVS